MDRKKQLSNVLDASRLTNHDGILIGDSVAGPTVWDGFAEIAPIHAVISGEDEAAEQRKSAVQIEEIEALVSEATVLLDLGCGYGRIAKYLLPRARLAAYIGIDGSSTMLRLFKARHESSEQESATPAVFVNSDMARLPILDGSIDLVVVSAVFLHNHKSIVRSAMSEIGRVLKTGGKILVYSSFPRKATAMGIQGTAYQALLNILGTPTRNGPVRYYSKSELKELFTSFSRLRLKPTGFEVMPKSIIGLRGTAERVYRLRVSAPINRTLEKLVPAKWHAAFARHYDVLATK